MKKNIKIADTEWIIMKALWANAPCSAGKIIEELEGSADWKPRTIKTLISRLVKKKAVGYEQDKNSYIYFPLVSEDECIRTESQNFLDRFFNGSLNVMVSNLIESKKLSRDEIEGLRKLLDKIDEKDN